MKRELETLSLPPLGAILAFHGVHALVTITNEGRLRATHYASCLIRGREPMWGVWTVNGVFQRFFGSREQIENDRQYRRLSWRRQNATWHMTAIETKNTLAEERRQELRTIFKRGESAALEPAAYLLEDGTIVPASHRERIKGPFRPLHAGPVENNNVVQLSDAAKVA